MKEDFTVYANREDSDQTVQLLSLMNINAVCI